jgi:hypothetical protein
MKEEMETESRGKWAKFWKGKVKGAEGKGDEVREGKDKKSGKWLNFRSPRRLFRHGDQGREIE